MAGGQAAIGPQTVIWAGAVRVARRGPPGGKPGRALVFCGRGAGCGLPGRGGGSHRRAGARARDWWFG
jgi:hypothetical protein